jgi:ABC-type molybdate transport system substrate-binding protein
MLAGFMPADIWPNKWEDKMSKSVIRLLAIVAAGLAGLYAAPAGAAELKVLSTEAMRPMLQELAPAFEAASKNKLVITYASDADVEKQVASDDTIDIAIVTKVRMDKLIRAARILTPPASKVLATGASPDLVYVAGSSFFTEEPLAARALVDFLAGPEAKKVYEAKGLKIS